MLPAKKANEATTKIISTNTNKEMKLLSDEIEIAINNGKYSVTIPKSISISAKKRLETLGYIVTHSNHHNEVSTTIKWAEV